MRFNFSLLLISLLNVVAFSIQVAEGGALPKTVQEQIARQSGRIDSAKLDLLHFVGAPEENSRCSRDALLKLFAGDSPDATAEEWISELVRMCRADNRVPTDLVPRLSASLIFDGNQLWQSTYAYVYVYNGQTAALFDPANRQITIGTPPAIRYAAISIRAIQRPVPESVVSMTGWTAGDNDASWINRTDQAEYVIDANTGLSRRVTLFSRSGDPEIDFLATPDTHLLGTGIRIPKATARIRYNNRSVSSIVLNYVTRARSDFRIIRDQFTLPAAPGDTIVIQKPDQPQRDTAVFKAPEHIPDVLTRYAQ